MRHTTLMPDAGPIGQTCASYVVQMSEPSPFSCKLLRVSPTINIYRMLCLLAVGKFSYTTASLHLRG